MGPECRHVRCSGLPHSVRLRKSYKGSVCDSCRKWYGDTIRATNKAVWVREGLEAIEAVLGLDLATSANLPDASLFTGLPTRGLLGNYSCRRLVVAGARPAPKTPNALSAAHCAASR
jgi:hypothetical protein